MNTSNKKQNYQSPFIASIGLDNEISLILVSNNGLDDPGEPGMMSAGNWNEPGVRDHFL
jgi:hypothetical protein